MPTWIEDDAWGDYPNVPVRVKVYCDGPAPFHDRFGRTWLETFERREGEWHPVIVRGARQRQSARKTGVWSRPRSTGVAFLDGDNVKPVVSASRTGSPDLRARIALACPGCHAGPVVMLWDAFGEVLDGITAQGEDTVSLRALELATGRATRR